MGLYTQPKSLGLDFQLQGLQTRLYNRLKSEWNITDSQWNCFGRADRNYYEDSVKGKGYIPEFYDASSNSYLASNGTSNLGGIFFESSLAVVSFFGLMEPMKRQSGQDDMARVELIMFVRLDQITSGGIPLNQQQGQRLDEVCINDVKNYIRSQGNNFCVTDSARDVDKVLDRYSGWQKNDSLKRDMQPYFCFKIILTIPYNTFFYKYNPAIG